MWMGTATYFVTPVRLVPVTLKVKSPVEVDAVTVNVDNTEPLEGT